MNFIQRLYCRTFQCCFRIAIPWLPYRKPQTITQLEQLPEVLRREGCRRVLLVTDQALSDWDFISLCLKCSTGTKLRCSVMTRRR